MLYSSATGWANFKGLSLRLEKRYSAGLFFLANYQLSENRDNGSGEVEANDTAFRTDFDADEGLSRYHQRHRSAFSFGYELPFGEGRRYSAHRRSGGYVLGDWQVQGVVRVGSGFPFTLSGTNVCQCGSSFRSGSTTRRAARTTAAGSTTPRSRGGTTHRLRLPAAGFQGTVGRNTLIGPGSKPVDFSASKRFPFGPRGWSSGGRSSTSSTTRTSDSPTGTSTTSRPASSRPPTTRETCSSAYDSPGEGTPTLSNALAGTRHPAVRPGS